MLQRSTESSVSELDDSYMEQLYATNSRGLFRKIIFFSKGAGSSVVSTEKQRLAVVVVPTIKWLYSYLVIHIMS